MNRSSKNILATLSKLNIIQMFRKNIVFIGWPVYVHKLFLDIRPSSIPVGHLFLDIAHTQNYNNRTNLIIYSPSVHKKYLPLVDLVRSHPGFCKWPAFLGVLPSPPKSLKRLVMWVLEFRMCYEFSNFTSQRNAPTHTLFLQRVERPRLYKPANE